MRTFSNAKELKDSIGVNLGSSNAFIIDQKMVNTFADLSGDHQWIHVDVERAKSGPYGTTIVHGLLTLSVSQHLAHSVYELKNQIMGLNYGSNKVRYLAPLRVPASISVGVELLNVEERSDMSQIWSRVTTSAEGYEKPVCVFEPITLCKFYD